jgi:hypothetical protein
VEFIFVGDRVNRWQLHGCTKMCVHTLSVRDVGHCLRSSVQRIDQRRHYRYMCRVSSLVGSPTKLGRTLLLWKVVIITPSEM